MIPGIVAAQSGGAGGGGIPDGALVHLDFINGVYYDGAVATAADVIGEPQYITSSGLDLSYDNESSAGEALVHLIGDALAAVLTLDWTIVLEYQEFYNNGQTNIFVLANGSVATEDEAVLIYRGNAGDGLEAIILDRNDALASRTLGDLTAHGIGTHRIAVTRTDSRMAISVNGGAVVTNETDLATVEVVNATFGGTDGDFLSNDFNLRSFTVYAAQDDSALPGLSVS